jgi:tetrahydromethanopterin S-methyltransferase subunit D
VGAPGVGGVPEALSRVAGVGAGRAGLAAGTFAGTDSPFAGTAEGTRSQDPIPITALETRRANSTI